MRPSPLNSAIDFIATQRRRFASWLTCGLVAITILSNCSDPPPTRISGMVSSPEEVCQKVLDALATNDTLMMGNLVLTRFEHDSVLVPLMPSPPPGVERDMSLAWLMLYERDVKGIRRAFEDYGGQRFTLVTVKFTKPDKIFGDLRAHQGTVVTVRDSTGSEFGLPIFGSILEDHGRFKLVSVRD